MILDQSFKDDSNLDSSNYNSQKNKNNPIRVTRITQRDTDIKKKEEKTKCC